MGAETDPAQWYEAAATASGLAEVSAQTQFADDLLTDLRQGMTVRDGNTTFTVAPQRVGTPAGRAKVTARGAAAKKPSGPIDAPAGLSVEWVPAPYEQYGPDPGDYGNHDLAFRPRSPQLTHVVIHDTECSYELGLQLVTD
mgnify:CR=1 FL=1